MDVEIYRVTLIVEGHRERLNKAIAKQFPILDFKTRWNAAVHGEQQQKPICKVAGQVLGQIQQWMYLVEDPMAGLAWVAAVQMVPHMAESVQKNGGWVDHPESVPTAIL